MIEQNAELVELVKCLNEVGWTRFFSLIHNIGDALNGSKDRFDKSDLIEKGLAHYSDNIEYVNRNGVDHIVKGVITLEMKFQAGSFYKNKNDPKNKNGSVTIKLFNSNGENKRSELPANYAKYLLVCDEYSAYVIPTSKLILTVKGDGISAKIPRNMFTKIISSEDITLIVLPTLPYKELKNKMQEDYLNQF